MPHLSDTAREKVVTRVSQLLQSIHFQETLYEMLVDNSEEMIQYYRGKLTATLLTLQECFGESVSSSVYMDAYNRSKI